MSMRNARQRLLTATLLSSGAAWLILPIPALALPQGGVVSGGQAGIAASGSQMTVSQSSQRAVIDWSTFNIGFGEGVRFNQPSASSIALNRINDANPSQIDGSLTANGQVWLVNPNGVMFGKGAQVNVGGLLATTADIDNSRFMAGDYTFNHPGQPSATVENDGQITVAQAGLAALVAPSVVNQGTITAKLGKVQLASGDTFALDLYGDGLINLQASPAIQKQLVENSGTINADGGTVTLTAAAAENTLGSLINLTGLARAEDITIKGDVVNLTGSLEAAGDVSIVARNIGQQGTITAGNSIDETFTGAYLDNAASLTKAGSIDIEGGGSFFASGHYDVSNATGTGGSIALTADQMWLYAASLDASGATGGGNIAIGGDLHGSGSLAHANEVTLNPYTTLNADATGSGNGGQIVVWSDSKTVFGATASAKGGPQCGNGGLIEVSSAGQDYVGGTTDGSAAHGSPGTVLIDPHNIVISDDPSGGGFMYFELVDPDPSASDEFGYNIVPLSTGNIVVTAPQDNFAASNSGAAYLFNGATGALISTLTGSNASDGVGSRVVVLTGNGNYVVASFHWNSNTGEATWCSGTTGCTGTVSAANSLVGSSAGDYMSLGGVTALTNGNYVVATIYWNGNMGAATWVNGTNGHTSNNSNTTSSANSLVGSNAGDDVSIGGVTALTNGNYVVNSLSWNGGMGAATWGDGITGITGTIDSSNSLVGSISGDDVGIGGVTALTNGNYVVMSQYWNNGGNANNALGAVTWVNGTNGHTSNNSNTISSANSLVGAQAGDRISNMCATDNCEGTGGVMALTNGNYVISSPQCNSGIGAVTWGSGATGITGTIDSSNSLVGSNAGDHAGLGGVRALTDGNYVVNSYSWNNNTGAATWGSGCAWPT